MATIISEKEVGEYVVNGTFIINGSTRPDADSKETKKFTLRVKFNQVPVQDIVSKALEPTKINKVNNHLRPKFDTWKSGDTFEIDFRAPGRRVPTEEENIQELASSFMAKGLDEKAARELAEKVVRNPELLTSK